MEPSKVFPSSHHNPGPRVGMVVKVVAKYRIFLVVLSLLLAAGFSSAFSGTEGLSTESLLLDQRGKRPDLHFLLDGNSSITLGEHFYQSFPAGNGLWPLSPYQRETTPWFGENALEGSGFSLLGGNEVGDPHLQELTGISSARNHTPFAKGFFWGSPHRNFTMQIGYYQNDHFSSGTVAYRSQQSGGEKLAWFGENIPPISLLHGGVSYQTEELAIQTQYEKGWIWAISPYSGNTHGFQTQNFLGKVRWGPYYLKEKRVLREAIGEDSTDSWSDNLLSLGGERKLKIGATHLEGWVEAGWRNRQPHLDSTLRSRHLSQAVVDLGFNVEPDSSKENGIISQGTVRWTSKDWAGKGLLGLKVGLFGFHLRQGVEAYYWDQEAFFPPVEEKNFDGNWMEPDPPTGFGGRVFFGAGLPLSVLRFSWKTGAGWENSVPYFQTDTSRQVSAIILRSGHLEKFSPLFHWDNQLSLETDEEIFNTGFRGFTRQFFGSDKNKMEYTPSPFLAQFFIQLVFPTELTLETEFHFLGPKEISFESGGTGLFRMESHWENQLALTQILWKNRLRLKYAALHAFGREVLEHPNGNPLRFRVLIGMEANL